MDHRYRRSVAASVIGVALCWTISAGRSSAADLEPTLDLTPYLWVPTVTLTSSAPGSSEGSSDVDRFATKIAAGAMMTAQVRVRSVGLFVDGAWVRLKTDSLSPSPLYTAVHLQSDVVYSTAALTYQLPLPGPFQAQALAGARYWRVSEDFTAQRRILADLTFDERRQWFDAMVGTILSYQIASRWSAQAILLVGGGQSAELAADLFAGIQYRYTSWGSVTLGYRYVEERYDHDAYTYDLRANAGVLGLGFHL